MEQTIEMVTPQIEAIAKDINEWNYPQIGCANQRVVVSIATEQESGAKLPQLHFIVCV
jgi:hypothetical protein